MTLGPVFFVCKIITNHNIRRTAFSLLVYNAEEGPKGAIHSLKRNINSKTTRDTDALVASNRTEKQKGNFLVMKLYYFPKGLPR